jgi:hypothetical protein
MFRVECFCDDKKLAKVLWVLQSVGVYNVSSQPVVNAEKSKGKIRAKTTAADKLEILRQLITQRDLKEIGPTEIKEVAQQAGINEKGYSNILRAAIKARMLSRVGKTFRYRVKPEEKG